MSVCYIPLSTTQWSRNHRLANPITTLSIAVDLLDGFTRAVYFLNDNVLSVPHLLCNYNIPHGIPKCLNEASVISQSETIHF